MNSKRIDSLFADSRKIQSRANRDAVQYIINCGEVNAADTIRDDKDRAESDFEWLAIETIASCLSSGEYGHHVINFFTSRGVKY